MNVGKPSPPSSDPSLPGDSRADDLSSLGLDRWRERPRVDPPNWPDQRAIDDTFAVLLGVPPVVSVREVEDLQTRLAHVAGGEAFLLQGGDSLEIFADTTEQHLSANWRLLLQMSVVLTYASGLPVVKLGRVAGQYARVPPARIDALGLPSYAGDMINSLEPAPESRVAEPLRMTRAYANAVAAMNMLRAYDDLVDLSTLHRWNREFVDRSAAGERYEAIAREIDRAVQFVRAWGGYGEGGSGAGTVYSSHEAVVLEYERAFSRRVGDRAYGLSAHSVWLGAKTCQVDGAHVDYLSRIANPIGVHLGPTANAETAVELCGRLNPHNIPGRLTFTVAMGNLRVRDLLPGIVEGVLAAGHEVVWQCDPMSQNTHEAHNGYRTRHFDRIVDEVLGYFEVHRYLKSFPGGIHLEMTGDDVTECLGGAQGIEETELPTRYETASDPRLNTDQALEAAFLVAEMLRG